MADAKDCKHEAGEVRPVIDRNRCEGKDDCVRVCPYNVFELRKLTTDEKQSISLLARLKVFAHGGKQAFSVREADCRGCGRCVTACPESAIKLERVRV